MEKDETAPNEAVDAGPVLEAPELLADPAPDAAREVGQDELARAFGAADASPEVDRQPAPSTPEPQGAAKPWSKTRLKEAKRTDMQRRIRELEAIAANQPATSAAPSPEAGPVDVAAIEAQTRQALAGTFGVVSNVGARLRGEHWRLSGDEAEKLAGAWAPVVAPHLGTLVEYLPVGLALAVTAEIVMPRIEADTVRAKMEKAAPVQVEAKAVSE